MNAKISVFLVCVETIIYSLRYNLHYCTFHDALFTKEIPNEIILLCMNYDVAFRLEKSESRKK